MNLGGFAGGLAQGLQGQQRINLAQQQQDQAAETQAQNAQMQERRMVMAERDQAAQEAERARKEAMRSKSAEVFKKYYGEKAEPVAESVGDDGAGNLARIPTMKVSTKQPGMDPEYDAKWAMENMQVLAEYSGLSREDMESMASYVDRGKRTVVGKALDRVLSGDQSAITEFVKGIGKDPTGARLEIRPLDGVMQITLANGEPLDLKRAAMASATEAYFKNLLAMEKSEQATATTKANLKNLNANADQTTAETQLLPEKAAKLKAETYAANMRGKASAARAAVGGGGGGTGKLPTRDIQAAVKMVTPRSADGKADSGASAILLGLTQQALAGGKAKDANSAAAAARAAYDKVAGEADKRIAALRAAKRKPADFGASSWEEARNSAIAQRLGGGSPAPAATDDNDEE